MSKVTIEKVLESWKNTVHPKDEIEKAASAIIVEALERRIPMKPYYEGDGFDDEGNIIYDNAECPVCGNDEFEYGINNWGCAYCPDCGQALDWEVEDEAD